MVSDAIKRSIEEAFGMDFEETQGLDCVDVRELMERHHGAPCTLAVPIYDSNSRRWIHDLNHFCNPEADYQQAMRRLSISS